MESEISHDLFQLETLSNHTADALVMSLCVFTLI